jgi:hypothetical protein
MKKLLARVINRLVRPMGLACVVKPQIPAAAAIPEQCLVNARIVANRTDGLYLIPKGGVVAEVGVAFGSFSRDILRVVQPDLFVAIDTFELDKASLSGHNAYKSKFGGLTHEDYYKRLFSSEIEMGKVDVRNGYSSVVMNQFSDSFFDMIYIDAAHDYDNVRNDLDIATRKIKSKGIIVLNDYTVMDPLLLQHYGIVQAVNELCENGQWEFVYLALHRYMFCDVAITRAIA